MKIRAFITFLIIIIMPVLAEAQKITVGTCTTKDGAAYNGEMLGSKPHGKGIAKFKNGDVYVSTNGRKFNLLSGN